MAATDYFAVDDDDGPETLEETGLPAREQLVFLIDAHSEMFEPLQEDQSIRASSLFDLVLRVCTDVFRSRIIDSPRDELSIVFYGTKEKHNDYGSDHVYVYMDLDMTDVERIKQIASTSDESVRELVGPSSDTDSFVAESLKLGLSTCTELLKNKSFHLSASPSVESGLRLKTAKTVLLFTANDVPCASSPHIRHQIFNRAGSMQEEGIQLRVFLLPSRRSRSSSFWKEVNEKARISEELDDFDEDVLSRLENFFDSVRKRVTPKRVLTACKLTVIRDLACAVNLYAVVRPSTKGKMVKIDSRTNDEVVPSSAYVCNDTGAKLDAVEQFSFGAARTDPGRYPLFVMTREDIEKARAEDAQPGIVILGFRPVSALGYHHQIGSPLFVYPDERSLEGSAATFIALHEKMLETETLAICQYSRTATAEPRFAALLPQQEILDSDRRQVAPPGMHLIQLPFMDDIRYPEYDPKITGEKFHTADAEQVAAADSLVDALSLAEDFTTTDVANPHLQRHFQVIEARALDEDIPDLAEFVDDTAPDGDWISESAEVEKAFAEAIRGDDDAEAGRSPGKKRRIAETEDARSFVAKTNWRSLAENDELNTLTAEKLKRYLEFHRLPMSGRKADLIDRIKEHLNT